MAAFVKFHTFIGQLGLGGHNLDTATIKVALTNTAPTAATDADLTDITEISAGAGYSAGGATVANAAYSQTSGTGKLTGDDVVFTASGGDIGPFRYAVLYNDTASDLLIGYWDYGSSITITDGNSHTVDFNASNGILQVA